MIKSIETIKADYDEYTYSLKALWTYYDELKYLRSKRLKKLYNRYCKYYNPPQWIIDNHKNNTNQYCYTVIHLLKIH